MAPALTNLSSVSFDVFNRLLLGDGPEEDVVDHVAGDLRSALRHHGRLGGHGVPPHLRRVRRLGDVAGVHELRGHRLQVGFADDAGVHGLGVQLRHVGEGGLRGVGLHGQALRRLLALQDGPELLLLDRHRGLGVGRRRGRRRRTLLDANLVQRAGRYLIWKITYLLHCNFLR